jgi:adenylate cyclase
VQYFAERSEQHQDIALILLDQDSLDWTEESFGLSFPWPREIYAYIVSYLQRAGIEAFAMDVLFVDSSTYGVYDDQQLGSALAEVSNDAFALFLGNETGSTTSWPPDAPEAPLTVTGLERLPLATTEALSYPRGLFPIPEIATNVTLLANVQNPQDSDGIFRRGPLFVLFDGRVVPGLGLASYLLGNDASEGLSVTTGGQIRLGGQAISLDEAGNVVLRFKKRSESRTYSASALLNSELQIREGATPDLDPALFAGKYVLFGFSAPGLLDLRPTPLAPATPGVEVHATLLDNLLTDTTMTIVAPWSVVALILVSALGVALLGSWVTGARNTALLYLVVVPLPVLASFGSYAGGFWIPLVAVELAALLSLVSSNVVNYATEGRQKRFIKGAFSQYLSPGVIEQLISHPERLRLGGERRELSIFFSDLQGFTSISESLSPEELTTLLNDYLSAMTDIIQEEGGTIDKYEGDAIIAFWNAPLFLEDHGLRGVRAAVRCQEKLAELRPAFEQRSGKELYMRIGMNSGPAVVGNMGSTVRFDYTMLGDAVNLAARLEGINKQFGTYTMISEATRALAGDSFAYREISRVRVVGKKLPVVVYEPMTAEDYARRRSHLETFDRGRDAFYRGDFAGALSAFEEIRGVDPAAEKYTAKCKTLFEAPPADWDGVWNMTEK